MDAEYIPVEQVAQLLAVSTRHAHRACQKADVRSTKAGKRTLYHRLDVERLAVELGAEYRHAETTPAPLVAPETAAASTGEPSTALVPYDALQRQLTDMQAELAEVRDMVELLVNENRQLALLVQQHTAADPPAAEQPTPRRRAWWRRLFT